MAQGMHADIMNILVSKRLDRWRRHISEKRSKSRIYCIPVKPFIWFQTTAKKKRMAKLKCSTSFLRIFSTFSSNFLQTFQMTKLNCFHHHRSTDVCKNTGIGKTFYSKECFLCKNSSTGCTTSASTDPVPVVAISLKHLIWHLVCVCVHVSGWISQPYIVLCPVSKHKLAEMPQQDRFLWMTPLDSCKNNGWDGETEPSSDLQRLNMGTVYMKQKGTHLTIHWGYHFEAPRACSMHRPAKRRVLTTQRARTAQYDFGGECHPDLQRLGNTETEKGLASCWR